jgi:hypothetical protein
MIIKFIRKGVYIYIYIFFFFFFLQYWSLNSGPIPSATSPALFCERFFLDKVLWNYFPELALNLDPSDLCLLIS